MTASGGQHGIAARLPSDDFKRRITRSFHRQWNGTIMGTDGEPIAFLIHANVHAGHAPGYSVLLAGKDRMPLHAFGREAADAQ